MIQIRNSLARWFISSLLVLQVSFLALAAESDGDEVTIAKVRDFVGRQQIQTIWRVTLRKLKQQPEWNALETEIPLSAREANAIAQREVAKTFPLVKKWSIQVIRLHNLGQVPGSTNGFSNPKIWYYQITLEPELRSDLESIEKEGGNHRLTQVILLDRTIVTPEVIKPKQ